MRIRFKVEVESVNTYRAGVKTFAEITCDAHDITSVLRKHILSMLSDWSETDISKCLTNLSKKYGIDPLSMIEFAEKEEKKDE